ncbi:Panacea domain-containing protein [Lactiplantibacillus plantarum]|uniref:Panacea domain-containing protein n=1 Tax=Lactiplantibacillus plantarum TaxID=1590 RepID=UPI000FECC59F|nr:type II toxin-antitoxin system antitoxin SocA domain-containing protein [Lactiplantibacillus plantarum]QAR36938.1 DUF4065 domain-containing protein [Lactiplantibacillus plantarum]RWZ07112.1 DUF4065 domain-containing protein [Lactiplantibacillus plantarum]RWZ34951.1 DUF4065 domain-containing protein [Lactiplantibacillus plantarum]
MTSKLYDPMDIANYLVVLANRSGKTITNLKLQKILYFVNAKYLVDNQGMALMDEKFQRWAYGPVMYNVYSNFRDCGAGAIEETVGTFELNQDNPFESKYNPFDDDKIDSSVKSVAKAVFDSLIDVDPFKLVRFTHEESLWSSYKEQIDQRTAPEYTDDEIYKYFKDHPEKCVWKSNNE